MEFYLVKEKRVDFQTLGYDATDHDKWSNQQHNLDLVDDCADKGSSEATLFRKALLDLLCKSPATGQNFPLPKRVQLYIFFKMTSSKTGNVKIFLENADKSKVNDAGKRDEIFDRVMKSGLPPTSIRFNLKLKLFLDGTTGTNQLQINRKDLEIVKFSGGFLENGLEINDVKITDRIWRQWDNDAAAIKGEVTLTLSLDHGAVTKLYLERFEKNPFNELHKKMFTDGFGSDLVILAGGEKDKEKGIKCHKSILSDRSPVLKTMIQMESKDFVEMEDMTEVGVRAMLQFIYCWDLEGAAKECETAFELLRAAYKYQIEDLEKAMTEIVLVMGFDWFSVDLAVKLLLFSRKVGEKLGKTEKRSLEVLKWYSQKSGSLMASEEYRRMMVENTQVAKELGVSFSKT